MKYNLTIGNIGKTLLIILMMIAWAPLSLLIINYLDGLFLRKNALIAMAIMFLPPITFLILWIVSQKNKDVFTLTEKGIESEYHGVIKWDDISICSWESLRGNIGIYLKLKSHKRLMIGPTSQWRNVSHHDLREFFDSIKKHNSDLGVKDCFKIYEYRISNIENIGLVIILISLLLVTIIINFCKK